MNPVNGAELNISPEEIEQGYENAFLMFKEVYPEIPQAVLEDFRSVTQVEGIRKNGLLTDYGEICRKMFIIIKGYVMINLHVDGEEVPMWFVGQGKITLAVKSFLRQVPSREQQVAVEDTFCIVLDRDQYQQIYDKHPAFQKLKELLFEFYYYEALDRIELTYSRPKVRYNHLMATWPHIILKASVAQLAKYLGIRRETLSRKRAELRKEKK